MHDRVEIARQLVGGGLSVVPIAPNGTKAPTVKWQRYQTRHATTEDIIVWFGAGRTGIGIIAGDISGHLEILDFDDGGSFEPWRNLADSLAPGIIETLPIVRSPSGGFHVYYRCPAVEGNQKLARAYVDGRAGGVKIETRGEGGYVLSPYCPPACHALRRPYELLQGSLFNVPTIPVDARHMFLSAARAFDEYVEPRKHTVPLVRTEGGDRPGDRFAQTHSWHEILEPHGWKVLRRHGDGLMWRRPGKGDHGGSATTGHNGHDVLYVFSTNAPPFDSERGYSKFTAFCLLNYRGDFSAAAQAVKRG